MTGVTPRHTRSLRTRFLLAMLAGQAAACCVILLPMFQGRDQLILGELERARLGRLSVVVAPFRDALVRESGPGMKAVLDALARQPDVLHAAFVTPEGPLAGLLPRDRRHILVDPDHFRNPGYHWMDDQLEVVLPVARASPTPLALVAAFDTAPVIERMDTLLLSGVALGMGALVLGCLLTFLISRPLIRGLEAFARFAREVAAGTPTPEPLEDSVYELDLVAQTLNAMSGEVERSRRSMQQYNQDLSVRVEQTSRELQAAHERLLIADRVATTGRMAAEVAHEIRNPLAAVSLELDSIEELTEKLRHDPATPPEPEQMAELERSLRSSRVSLSRIEALLEGYRSFQRASDSRSDRLGAADLVEVARSAFQEVAGDQASQFVTETEGEPPAIEVDVARLRIALQEVFKNSLEAFSKRGETTMAPIRFSLRAADPDLLIQIEDECGGMPRDLAARATAPFVSTRPNRSGLGLPLALQIARDMGGNLELDSTPGRGTCIRFRLPGARRPDGGDHGRTEP